MHELFDELEESRSGCSVGSYYDGVFDFTDDLLLICPSCLVAGDDRYQREVCDISQDPVQHPSSMIYFAKRNEMEDEIKNKHC